MHIERIDHLVLNVHDLDATIRFYREVLGMRPLHAGDGRHALAFGTQQLKLYPVGAPATPHAAHPTRGSANLCFVSTTPIKEIVSQLERFGIAIEAGPVARAGALGAVESVYFRDPDGNLIEVSNYPD
ncbi:VOC family protein [Solimonas variicoloris]|uniref:VOC family protein n=1 Tax=Solimonas variicoloris TaxID=254408 RepID=UPI00036F68AA|nr:VOC family protein [Solimonas variicoloris]